MPTATVPEVILRIIGASHEAGLNWITQAREAGKVKLINVSFIGYSLPGDYVFDSLDAALSFVEQYLDNHVRMVREPNEPYWHHRDADYRLEYEFQIVDGSLEWHAGAAGFNSTFYFEVIG